MVLYLSEGGCNFHLLTILIVQLLDSYCTESIENQIKEIEPILIYIKLCLEANFVQIIKNEEFYKKIGVLSEISVIIL